MGTTRQLLGRCRWLLSFFSLKAASQQLPIPWLQAVRTICWKEMAVSTR